MVAALYRHGPRWVRSGREGGVEVVKNRQMDDPVSFSMFSSSSSVPILSSFPNSLLRYQTQQEVVRLLPIIPCLIQHASD